MNFNFPLWLAIVETLGFLAAVVGLIYNRLMSWKKFNERTVKLEIAFEQYQKDIAHYLEVCELCRLEVRKHHEDDKERHVTPSMKEQIQGLVTDVAEIKRFLMEHPR